MRVSHHRPCQLSLSSKIDLTLPWSPRCGKSVTIVRSKFRWRKGIAVDAFVAIWYFIYICIDYKEISKLIGHISLPNCWAINLRIEKIGICLYRYRFRNLGAIFQTVSFPTPSGRPKRRALITLFPAIDRLWTCFHRDNLAPCHAPCHSTMLSLT